MLLMVTYSFSPDARDAAQKRFKKTGALPGPGTTMKGRWHDAAGHRGFMLVETSDTVSLGRWLQEWTDLLEFEATPVNTDEDAMKVLAG